MNQSTYGFSKVTVLGYEDAIAKLIEELRNEGFGVLMEIDMKETLKQRLDVDIRPYKILGACNPPSAYKALLAEEQIGLLLPCNVIVYVNESNATVVAAIDPVAAMKTVGNESLREIADAIQEKLKKVITAL